MGYHRPALGHPDFYVLDVIGAPDILGVQEAESLNVLQDLADAITAVDPSVVYTPYLEEGNDVDPDGDNDPDRDQGDESDEVGWRLVHRAPHSWICARWCRRCTI